MLYFYLLSVVASPILDKNSLIWLCYMYVAVKASERSRARAGAGLLT
jgi:hypothetical protein